MMPGAPRVTVVTPSYNQKNFLENTILSVLEQGYANLEYLIMDGGSTDGSVEIIKRYSKYLAYWQSEPDGGQVRAINAGFQRSSGDIFAFLNSDDFFLEGAIQHIVALHDQFPQAAGWVGGGYDIAQDGFILQTRIPKKVSRDDLANWAENWIHQPACFFSAQAARRVGLLNESYQNSFDFDFWLRITRLGELIPTRRVLAAATIHPNAKTQKYKVRMFEEVQSIQRANGYENFAEETQKFIDQARTRRPISSVASLLYQTYRAKKEAPNRFVRLPGSPKVPPEGAGGERRPANKERSAR
ncbi:MAG TPA: glycosyltransferase family 2 protein [Anaerolineales bacterium]|nr:glycosyltransferase family 2 protein [Anaerolineales bacterium]